MRFKARGAFFQKKKAITYTCHAGVQCIAVPFIISGEHYATVFVGENVPSESKPANESIARVRKIARKIDIPESQLLKFYDELSRTESNRIESKKEELWKHVSAVAALEGEKREIRKERHRILQESILLELETSLIQKVMPSLSEIVPIREFWPRLDGALERISGIIGATISAFFISEGDNSITFALKACSGVSKESLKTSYLGNDFFFRRALDKNEPSVIDFDPSQPDTICNDIYQASREALDKVAIVPFSLTGTQHAVMLFILNEESDIETTLPIEREVFLLARFAPQIATAFQNCLLFSEKMHIEKRINRELDDKTQKLKEKTTELEGKTKELERLSDIGMVMTRRTSLRSSLGFIAKAASNILGGDIVSIIPYDADLESFQLEDAACFGAPRRAVFTSAKPRSHGTLARIRESGIVIVPDTSNSRTFPFLSKRTDALVRRIGVRSFIGARLRVGTEDIGVIYINFLKARSFDAADEDTIRRLANHAATAIASARAHAGTVRHLSELSTLNKISNVISSSAIFRQDQLLDTLYRQVSKLMDTENSYVAFLDHKKSKVEFATAYEDGVRTTIGRGEWKPRISGNGLTEIVLRSKKSLLIKKDVEDWLTTKGVDVIGKIARSWLGAPMIVRGEVLGMIAVQSYTREYEYDEYHQKVLASIAAQAAGAFQIRNLLDELRRTKTNLEKMVNDTLMDTENRFAKQFFYDTISHDLRNFITVADSSLEELLASPAIRKLPKGYQKSVQNLIGRAQKSSETIEKFLNLTREFRPREDFFDLNTIVRQVLDLQAVAFNENDIRVDDTEIVENMPRLRINQMQITMVVFNLTTNAIKALRKVDRDRVLKVSTGPSKDKKWYELVIEDNGCGIKSGDRDKVFRPYFSDDSKGVGLGLFGCKKILESIDGTISLRSRFGKGATFTVKLPRSLCN